MKQKSKFIKSIMCCTVGLLIGPTMAGTASITYDSYGRPSTITQNNINYKNFGYVGPGAGAPVRSVSGLGPSPELFTYLTKDYDNPLVTSRTTNRSNSLLSGWSTPNVNGVDELYNLTTFGLLNSTYRFGSQIAGFTYDPVTKLVSCQLATDGNGTTATVQYDSAVTGRVNSISYVGQTHSFSYGAKGTAEANRVYKATVTDSGSGSPSTNTFISHSRAGKILSLTNNVSPWDTQLFSSLAATMTYTGPRKYPSTITLPSGAVISYTYPDNNSTVGSPSVQLPQSVSISGTPFITQIKYNPAFVGTGIASWSGAFGGYTYSQTSDPYGAITGYSYGGYLPTGSQGSVSVGVDKISGSPTPDGYRVSSLTYPAVSLGPFGTAVAPSSYSLSFGFNDANQVVQATGLGATTTATYDTANNLITSTGTGTTASYSSSNPDLITSSNFWNPNFVLPAAAGTYSSVGQALASTKTGTTGAYEAQSYQYDNNGQLINLTSQVSNGSGASVGSYQLQLQWNNAHQLARVDTNNPGLSAGLPAITGSCMPNNVRYYYDAFGKRVRKAVYSNNILISTTNYMYHPFDQNKMMVENILQVVNPVKCWALLTPINHLREYVYIPGVNGQLVPVAMLVNNSHKKSSTATDYYTSNGAFYIFADYNANPMSMARAYYTRNEASGSTVFGAAGYSYSNKDTVWTSYQQANGNIKALELRSQLGSEPNPAATSTVGTASSLQLNGIVPFSEEGAGNTSYGVANIAASQARIFQGFSLGSLAGQVVDTEVVGNTGLVYNNARFFHKGVGRFISGDPLGRNGGINVYAYGYGPGSWVLLGVVDESGLWATDAHNYIIDQYFTDEKGYTEQQRNAIKAGSAHTDRWQAQFSGDSALHAMRNFFDTEHYFWDNADYAHKRLCQHVNKQLSVYRSSSQTEDIRYKALGEALHPIMDSTSPAHSYFKTWWWLNGVIHGGGPTSIESLVDLQNHPELLTETNSRMDAVLNGDTDCSCIHP